MHAAVGSVDDIDVAALVDFDIVGLDHASAHLCIACIGAAFVCVGAGCLDVINVAQNANLRIS